MTAGEQTCVGPLPEIALDAVEPALEVQDDISLETRLYVAENLLREERQRSVELIAAHAAEQARLAIEKHTCAALVHALELANGYGAMWRAAYLRERELHNQTLVEVCQSMRRQVAAR